MGKSSATILGIAMLAGAAIWVGRAYLFPAAEKTERKEAVLTGAMKPRLESAYVLQDSELPGHVPAPRVGEDAMYMRVSILYPGLPEVPQPDAHRLTEVNGHPAARQDAAHVETEVDDEGARIHLYFRVSSEFEQGTIARGNKTVLESFLLE